MTLEEALTELTVIEQRLHRILAPSSIDALYKAKQRLESYRPPKGKGKKKPSKPWYLIIEPQNPLVFSETDKTTSLLKHQVKVDVFCSLSQPHNGTPLDGHSLAMRLWSREESLVFRKDFDAECLLEQITGNPEGRVICRFHFDYANPLQPGPMVHLQAGGAQHGGEFCWHPESLEIPRFIHHPMNLIMACEFILRTFYPREYEEIAEDSSWKGALRKAQQAYLIPYLDSLQGPNWQEDSFLCHLWNN